MLKRCHEREETSDGDSRSIVFVCTTLPLLVESLASTVTAVTAPVPESNVLIRVSADKSGESEKLCGFAGQRKSAGNHLGLMTSNNGCGFLLGLARKLQQAAFSSR